MAKRVKKDISSITETDDIETLGKMKQKLQKSFDQMAAKLDRMHKDPKVPLEMTFNATVLMNQTADKVFYIHERMDALRNEQAEGKSFLKTSRDEEGEEIPFGFAAHAYNKKKAEQASNKPKPN